MDAAKSEDGEQAVRKFVEECFHPLEWVAQSCAGYDDGAYEHGEKCDVGFDCFWLSFSCSDLDIA